MLIKSCETIYLQTFYKHIRMKTISASFKSFEIYKDYIWQTQPVTIHTPEGTYIHQILKGPSIFIHVSSSKPLVLQDVDFIATEGPIILKARTITVVEACTFSGKSIQLYADQLIYRPESKSTVEQLKHVIKPYTNGLNVEYMYCMV